MLPYLLIVPAVTRLAQGAGTLAVAAATLAAVAMFQRVAVASTFRQSSLRATARRGPPAVHGRRPREPAGGLVQAVMLSVWCPAVVGTVTSVPRLVSRT